jgi:hypothetical protein
LLSLRIDQIGHQFAEPALFWRLHCDLLADHWVLKVLEGIAHFLLECPHLVESAFQFPLQTEE